MQTLEASLHALDYLVGDHRPFLFPVPPLPEGLYRLCLQSVDTVEVGQNTSLLFSVQ